MGICRTVFLVCLLATVLIVSPVARARPAPTEPSRSLGWTTLGTAGGPLVQPDRSQPANLLLVEGQPWLVDCGDGVSERLAGAGFAPAQVDTVFLSHLHIDHTAGLLGLIGLRWFTRAPHVLTIYGPSGTDVLVAGIISALQPTARIGIGVQGSAWGSSIADTVQVKIVKGGDDLRLAGVRIRAVTNSHFGDPAGRSADNGSQSLSYRFDRDDYGIAYTGDTGPSAAVAVLAYDVDLLVSEVIDIEPMTADILLHYPDMPAAAKQALIAHLRTQHLTPQAAGSLATEARARRLVLTHLTAIGPASSFEARLQAETRRSFAGPITVAHDLERF